MSDTVNEVITDRQKLEIIVTAILASNQRLLDVATDRKEVPGEDPIYIQNLADAAGEARMIVNVMLAPSPPTEEEAEYGQLEAVLDLLHKTRPVSLVP